MGPDPLELRLVYAFGDDLSVVGFQVDDAFVLGVRYVHQLVQKHEGPELRRIHILLKGPVNGLE